MSWSLGVEADRDNYRDTVYAKAEEVLKTDEEKAQLETALEAVEVIVDEMKTDRISISLSGHVAGKPGSGTFDKNSLHVSVNEL